MLGTAPLDIRREPLAPGAVERWQPPSFGIDPWLVLRLARYRQRHAVEPAVREAAEAMAARATTLIEPQALLGARPVAAASDTGARLRPGPAFSGRAVGRLLDGCAQAVPFVLTLGPRLEAEAAARVERREWLEAFLLDTAGWAAIETAVRALRQDLRARGRAGGFRVTHRLAPGYADWPLAEQRDLLDCLAGGGGLVRLTEHGVLVPFKSVSGLFGLIRSSS
jgi:hypothetical protein